MGFVWKWWIWTQFVFDEENDDKPSNLGLSWVQANQKHRWTIFFVVHRFFRACTWYVLGTTPALTLKLMRAMYFWDIPGVLVPSPHLILSEKMSYWKWPCTVIYVYKMVCCWNHANILVYWSIEECLHGFNHRFERAEYLPLLKCGNGKSAISGWLSNETSM